MTLIKACEPKTTGSGKPYWRAQLQPGGWASTFDTKIGATLMANVGNDIEVTTVKSDDGKYTNITAAKAVPQSGGPASSRDLLIVKEVALKAAVERFAGNANATDLDIIATAAVFTRWLLEPALEEEVWDPEAPV